MWLLNNLVILVQFTGSCFQHKWLLNGPVNEKPINQHLQCREFKLCLDDQNIPEIIGAPFSNPCCI